MLKTCSKCRVSFPLDMFGTDRSRPDGKYPACKPCRAAGINQPLAAKNRAAWAKNNPAKMNAYSAAWKLKNPGHVKARMARYFQRDAARQVQKNIAWAKANPERVRRYQRKWLAQNMASVLAKNSRRRAVSRAATPKWADREQIIRIYETCPPGFHVDHIIPLRGKGVCGLHVQDNLRHLPAHENHVKGARYE